MIRYPIRLILCVVISSHFSLAQNVSIGMFGLFHPHRLTLRAVRGEAVMVRAGNKTIALEPGPGGDIAQIRVFRDALTVKIGDQIIHSQELKAGSRSSGPVDFVLAVPGKITRRYRGWLTIKPDSGVLSPVVSMDIETAVASVVQAESGPAAPLEALKAQAVATRSYFLAGKRRHRNFDFCDTTHCQFLREPPANNSPAFAATLATRGLVLAYHEQPFAAMFTRSCSGRTFTPMEVGIPTQNYPYYSVECRYCLDHPARWSSRISQQDASNLLGHHESSRLRIVRRMGWRTVPSNSFTVRQEGAQVVLEGIGWGHGIGLCQTGAKAMAEAGADFHEILNHYYPNTTLIRIEGLQ